MAISFLQRPNNGVGSAASLAVTTTATAAGSILVVAGSFTRGTTLTSLVNSAGDTPTTVIPVTDDGSFFKYFCSAFLSLTAGVTSVTANYGPPNTNQADLFVWEIAGLTSPAADMTPNTNGSSASPDSGTTGTLSDANEAAIAYAVHLNLITGIGAPWANFNTSPVTIAGGAEQVVSSNAALDGNFTASASNLWVALVATFFNATAATPITAGFFVEDTTLHRQPQNQRMLKPDHMFATPAQPLPLYQNAVQPNAAGVVKVRMIPG